MLVEPPVVPTEPIKPNRQKMLVAGFGASIAAGVALVAGLEFIDGSIRGPHTLQAALNVVPIASIPYITTRVERRRRLTSRILLAILLVVLGLGALAAIHFYYMPLDELIVKVIDRFM